MRVYNLTFFFRDPTHKRADHEYVSTLQFEDDIFYIKLNREDLEEIIGKLIKGFVIYKIEITNWKFSRGKNDS